MICLIQQRQDGDITGWIIARDMADLRAKAAPIPDAALQDLLRELKAPAPGKHRIGEGGDSTVWLLVDAM